MSLSFNEAQRAWESIRSSSLDPLRQSLIRAAVRYAEIRVKWRLSDREARMEIDANRRAAHNVFIDACNIMSRNMAERNEDVTWRERLGNDRKRIGDLACYIHSFLGLDAR